MFKRNRVCIRSQRKLIVRLKMISCNLSKTINNVSLEEEIRGVADQGGAGRCRGEKEEDHERSEELVEWIPTGCQS